MRLSTKKFKIAIIGHGFVGQAMDYIFSTNRVEKTLVDPKLEWAKNTPYMPTETGMTTLKKSTRDLDKDLNAYFICVPTPMGENGEIDTTILDDVMKDLKGVSSLIVIKSTITPEVARKYQADHIVHAPEFLTEASHKTDAVHPKFHIIGGTEKSVRYLKHVFKNYSLCDNCPVHGMSMVEASMCKYAINSYLAMKVTFFNQLFDMSNENGTNYARIVKAIGSDKRIGKNHTKVPGFDGKRGYGGACFPKDTAALIKSFPGFTLVEKCVKINNQYREKYELLDREKEQAVSYKNKE